MFISKFRPRVFDGSPRFSIPGTAKNGFGLTSVPRSAHSFSQKRLLRFSSNFARAARDSSKQVHDAGLAQTQKLGNRTFDQAPRVPREVRIYTN